MLKYFIFDYLNLTHGFIYLTANYFIAAGIPFLLGDFSRKPWWKAAVVTFVEITVCIIIMEFFASVYFAIFNSDTYVPFVCGLLVLTLYAAIRSKKKTPVRIMQSAAYLGFSCLALTTTMSMGALLGVPYYYLQWGLISVNGIIICSSAFLIRYFSIKDETPVQPLYVVITVVMGALGFAYSVIRMVLKIDPAASVAICMIFIFAFFIVYFMLVYLSEKSYADACRQVNAIMRSSDREAFRLSNENLENLHKMRHELKNQYALMKSYLDRGDYENLGKYFSEFSDRIEETVNFTDCGNNTLNVILGIERGRAKDAAVDLDCKIAVPEKINIKDVDLCSLLMNLINNAVEYLERNKNVTERKIKVELYVVDHVFMAKMSNHILPEHKESALTLKTSKQNKNLHGYGSKIVARIVEKYNGAVDYVVKDGEFTVNVMLFIPTDSAQI